jgi:MoaA/NifB/PqqE/SkfB family radical SAM enzyme
MPATATEPASPAQAPEIPAFLELEITGLCQLTCTHCYAGSGPQGGPGTMTPEDWEHVINQAAAIGVTMVQFIGGEPALDPSLPRLIRHARAAGLKVYVYSNLVHVTGELWELLSQPGVSLGTSWYSADADTHAKITGSRASHARTSANIAEAVARGIFVRAAIVSILPGQDTERAAGHLRALGVTDIRIRPQQDLGRAARDGNTQDTSELCGRCGDNRAAIMADGQLTPCVVGRWLDSGNVKTTPLPDIFTGHAWQRSLAIVPRRDPEPCAPDTCPPASDGDDCPPASCQ